MEKCSARSVNAFSPCHICSYMPWLPSPLFVIPASWLFSLPPPWPKGVLSRCYWVKRHIPSSSPYFPFKLLDPKLLSFCNPFISFLTQTHMECLLYAKNPSGCQRHKDGLERPLPPKRLVGDPSNWTAQGIVGRRAQGGDIREGFPQEAWQELNDKEVSQPVEGLERREGLVHRGVRVGRTPAAVGGLHALLLLQCSSGRCLPKGTSDFLGSSSHLNLFIFHILTRAVIAATHSLVHELLHVTFIGKVTCDFHWDLNLSLALPLSWTLPVVPSAVIIPSLCLPILCALHESESRFVWNMSANYRSCKGHGRYSLLVCHSRANGFWQCQVEAVG